jgi:phosphodiesterase/alkaline phosphatase D-like protein
VRLFVGGVTHSSARFRLDRDVSLDGLPFDPRGISIEPRAGVVCTVVQDQSVPSVIVDASGLSPNTTYVATVIGTPGDRAIFRTAPAKVSATESLLLAFGSCYFPSDNFIRNPQAILDVLARRAPAAPSGETVTALSGFFPYVSTAAKLPHAIVHCGDQIYGDVPMGGGRDVYDSKYRDYWRDSQWGGVFRVGGHFFTPDDHEYWNNYPDQQIWLTRSWGGNWRRTAESSIELFWRHQGVWNFPPGARGLEPNAGTGADREFWSRVQLGEIDLFVGDSRSQRTSFDGKRRPGSSADPGSERAFMGSAQLGAFVDWTESVRRLGVVVLGQPLVMTPGGGTDYTLRDYPSQYATVMDAIWRAVDGRGVPIILLTGDIHWGRLMQFRSPRTDASFVEYIASPIGRLNMRSAFSTHYDGGPRARPGGWKESGGYADTERELIATHLRGAETRKHFTTWENHVGTLELVERNNRLTAVCQSWSLQTRDIAGNEWGLPPWNLCSAEIGL